MPVRRARLIAAWSAGLVALVLVLGQLLLPRIAAGRISDRLGAHGKVQSVSVSAWPAVKLLWGSADSVTVRASQLALSPGKASALLWEGRGADQITMTVGRARVGPLQLSGVRFNKRGNALTAEARASAADVKAALPPGFSVSLLSSGGGYVRVRTTGGLFGVAASVDAVAGPIEGKLVARPEGLLLSAFQLTLFSDPHVRVQGVGASVVPDAAAEPAYRLTMRAKLL